MDAEANRPIAGAISRRDGLLFGISTELSKKNSRRATRPAADLTFGLGTFGALTLRIREHAPNVCEPRLSASCPSRDHLFRGVQRRIGAISLHYHDGSLLLHALASASCLL
jgi:hypothetical protein